MPLIVLTAMEAARKEEQRQLEREIEEAGIVRVLSTQPPFHLTVVDDLEELAGIAATYRTKPRIAPASYEDVPSAPQSRVPTDQLVAFVQRAGYLFSWDEDALLWCVTGVRDGFPDQSQDEQAFNRRSAVIEAIRYLVE